MKFLYPEKRPRPLAFGDRVVMNYGGELVLGLVLSFADRGVHVAVMRAASPYATAFWNFTSRDDTQGPSTLKPEQWCSIERGST